MARALALLVFFVALALPPLLSCGEGAHAMTPAPPAMANCHEEAHSPAGDTGPLRQMHQSQCIGCIAPICVEIVRPTFVPDFQPQRFGPLPRQAELSPRWATIDPPPPRAFA